MRPPQWSETRVLIATGIVVGTILSVRAIGEPWRTIACAVVVLGALSLMAWIKDGRDPDGPG